MVMAKLIGREFLVYSQYLSCVLCYMNYEIMLKNLRGEYQLYG